MRRLCWVWVPYAPIDAAPASRPTAISNNPNNTIMVRLVRSACISDS